MMVDVLVDALDGRAPRRRQGHRRRIWRARKLRPWRVETFKLSNDPRFEEKLVDVVGLYLDPPERAVVFSFDEKTQCQALDRTQPSLPLKPGRARTMTHDYKRNGTVDLFAALNVGTGEVLHQTRKRSRRRRRVGVLQVDRSARPRDLDVHVVLDNLSAHSATGRGLARRSEAGPLAPALHPDQLVVAEPDRGLVRSAHQPAPTNGTFTSVNELVDAIDVWADRLEREPPSPSSGRKTAEEIITKVRRGRAALTTKIKSATDH
jgi:hypothetical protein